MELNNIKNIFFGKRLNLSKESSSIVERQRGFTFVYGLLTLIIGISINLIGISGPQDSFFIYINSAHLILILSVYLIFRIGKISLSLSLSLIFLITEFEIVTEMIYCAISGTTYHIDLFLGNMVLLAILQVLIMVTYLPQILLVSAVITLLTYSGCSLIANDSSLLNFLPIFVIVWAFVLWMGIRLISNVSQLEQENSGLKNEQQLIIDFLQMDKNQWSVIIALAKENKISPQQTNRLMSLLSMDTRRNIIDNVRQMIEQESIDYESLSKRLPTLARGEIEICKLILQGKSISEISTSLGKTVSNITCRRTNIRAKLGLKKEENLHEVLLNITKKE